MNRIEDNGRGGGRGSVPCSPGAVTREVRRGTRGIARNSGNVRNIWGLTAERKGVLTGTRRPRCNAGVVSPPAECDRNFREDLKYIL